MSTSTASAPVGCTDTMSGSQRSRCSTSATTSKTRSASAGICFSRSNSAMLAGYPGPPIMKPLVSREQGKPRGHDASTASMITRFAFARPGLPTSRTRRRHIQLQMPVWWFSFVQRRIREATVCLDGLLESLPLRHCHVPDPDVHGASAQVPGDISATSNLPGDNCRHIRLDISWRLAGSNAVVISLLNFAQGHVVPINLGQVVVEHQLVIHGSSLR